MADVFTTTADLLQLGDGNISDIDVTELLEDAPFLASMAAMQASYETVHEWLKKTAPPDVGFRQINDGRENSKATYTKRTETLQLFDASFAIDMGLLKARSGMALQRREAVDHLQAAFADMEKQVFAGTNNKADGFNGFQDEDSVNALADAKVVDAGGNAASGCSDVWVVRSGTSNVAIAYGLGATIDIGQTYPTVLPGSSTGRYDAERTPIMVYACVQVATTHDLVRIANIDAANPLTDDLISKALSLFPAGKSATNMAATRRSVQQLQASRTATNTTGAPAPFPESAFNVPIVVTDQISDTQAPLT